MNPRRTRILLYVFALGVSATTGAADSDISLVVESTITLGKVEGRIDHLAYDPKRKRLYVAELGNNSVGIVDLDARRIIKTVEGFDEPQGIAYEPSTDSVYVASGGNGDVDVFAAADFTPVTKIPTRGDADNVRADGAAGQVIVGYGDGALLIVDASRKKIGEIELPGHPESFQLAPDGDHVFVNVPGARRIVVASRKSNRVIASWPMNRGANYPMAIDAAQGRVFTVFRAPASLQAFDMATGKLLGEAGACGDADDVFADSKRNYLYVICGDGTVDTYAIAGNSFSRVAQLQTSRGSRTGLWLPELDRLVIAVRATERSAAAVWILRAAPPGAAPASILFVCEHGNVKSLMAASYFNELATARHLPYRAHARGTAPNSSTVPPAIVAGLRADGFEVADFHPAAVARADVASAERVILISTELPAEASAGSGATEKWADVPPASADYAAARDALKAHIRALLDQLSSQQ